VRNTNKKSVSRRYAGQMASILLFSMKFEYF